MLRRIGTALWALALLACSGAEHAADQATSETVSAAPRGDDTTMTGKDVTQDSDDPATPAQSAIATFGAGCFWCVEAVLEQVDGVLDVRSGYMGGHVPDPSYEQVCTGTTGHAEVVQLRFDPARIGYGELLEWFWRLHDPTTPNRQGNDVGPQYRSAVFVHDDAQRELALASMERAQSRFAAPIVTEITPASDFYPADEHHQDFYRANKQQGYCRAVIAPKLDKLGLQK